MRAPFSLNVEAAINDHALSMVERIDERLAEDVRIVYKSEVCVVVAVFIRDDNGDLIAYHMPYIWRFRGRNGEEQIVRAGEAHTGRVTRPFACTKCRNDISHKLEELN